MGEGLFAAINITGSWIFSWGIEYAKYSIVLDLVTFEMYFIPILCSDLHLSYTLFIYFNDTTKNVKGKKQ